MHLFELLCKNTHITNIAGNWYFRQCFELHPPLLMSFFDVCLAQEHLGHKDIKNAPRYTQITTRGFWPKPPKICRSVCGLRLNDWQIVDGCVESLYETVT